VTIFREVEILHSTLLKFISQLILVFQGDRSIIISPLEIFLFQKQISDTHQSLYGISKENAALICEAAYQGCHVYQKLLKQDRAIIRAQAAYLLGLFTDTSGNNLDCLKLHFASEADVQVRAAIVLSVSSIAQDKQVLIQWLYDIFDTDSSPFVKINVAFAICKSDPSNVPKLVIKLIIDSVISPDRDILSMFELFPWSNYPWGTSNGLEIIREWSKYSLMYISQQSSYILDALIENLDRVPEKESCEIVDCIVSVIFNFYFLSESRPPTTADKLASEQRCGLEAIANSIHFQSKLSAKSIANKLKSHLLPTTPAQLKAYLAGEISIINKYAWELPP
jgi:hypothetical protein